MSTLGLALRNPALLVLMMAHFTNDLFGGILPMYLPLMKDRFELSNAAIGFAILAYSGMSSLSQPLFGYFSDRHGGRRGYLAATLVWSAGFIAMYGFAPNYPVFLLMAGLAGIGSGAFHPIGASTVAQVTDDRHRNGSMSLYTVGGTIGWGLGPLVAVALLTGFGPRGSAFLLLPGLLIATLLYSQMGMVERVRQARATIGAAIGGERPNWGLLSRVVGVTMLRSWTFLSVVQFLPIWYSELGYGPGFYGPLVTIIILAGSAGTLLGGVFADRIGPRRVVVGSLALAIPALMLFLGLPGPLAFATGILFGVLADASLSVTLVMAQRLVPGRIGIASGVILGLGFVTGGIGVPITGWLADAVGIQAALMSLGVLGALAVLLALTLPVDQSRPAPALVPATR